MQCSAWPPSAPVLTLGGASAALGIPELEAAACASAELPRTGRARAGRPPVSAHDERAVPAAWSAEAACPAPGVELRPTDVPASSPPLASAAGVPKHARQARIESRVVVPDEGVVLGLGAGWVVAEKMCACKTGAVRPAASFFTTGGRSHGCDTIIRTTLAGVGRKQRLVPHYCARVSPSYASIWDAVGLLGAGLTSRFHLGCGRTLMILSS